MPDVFPTNNPPATLRQLIALRDTFAEIQQTRTLSASEREILRILIVDINERLRAMPVNHPELNVTITPPTDAQILQAAYDRFNAEHPDFEAQERRNVNRIRQMGGRELFLRWLLGIAQRQFANVMVLAGKGAWWYFFSATSWEIFLVKWLVYEVYYGSLVPANQLTNQRAREGFDADRRNRTGAYSGAAPWRAVDEVYTSFHGYRPLPSGTGFNPRDFPHTYPPLEKPQSQSSILKLTDAEIRELFFGNESNFNTIGLDNTNNRSTMSYIPPAFLPTQDSLRGVGYCVQWNGTVVAQFKSRSQARIFCKLMKQLGNCLSKADQFQISELSTALNNYFNSASYSNGANNGFSPPWNGV